MAPKKNAKVEALIRNVNKSFWNLGNGRPPGSSGDDFRTPTFKKKSPRKQARPEPIPYDDQIHEADDDDTSPEAGKPAANMKPGFGTGIGIETGSHSGIQKRGSLLTPLLTPCEVVVEKMPKKIIQRFVGMDTNKDSNVRVRNPSNNRPKPKSRQVLDSPPESMDALVVDHAGTAAVTTTIEKPM